MDDHRQDDQWQAPSPVVVPSKCSNRSRQRRTVNGIDPSVTLASAIDLADQCNS